MLETAALAPLSAPTESLPAARPLRVLHVIAPAPVGGLERVVCTLVPGQQAAGADVRVAAVVEPGVEVHPVIAELRDAGVHVDVVVLASRAYAQERRRIAALCRQWAPDVVHTHGYRPGVIDSGVARRMRIPCVSTFHGFTGGGWRNRLYEWLERRAARRMDAVVAVSAPLGERLTAAGVSRHRLHVVPNAHRPRDSFVERTAARRALGLPDEGFILGWVGRLTREKGADVLVDAMGLLGADNIVASFVGEGPERRALAARASSRAAGCVYWHGLVPDAARYLRAFDAFVLSSRTEGTPNVVFEAMEAETPIVATRVGGVPAMLGQQDALLVPAEHPAAIAEAIRRVRADRAAALTRATSARARLERDYTVGPWVERYLDVYRAVVTTPRLALR